MDVTRTLLHAGWEFAFAPHGAIRRPADCAALTFRPAAVPGTNLTDLQAAGLVEPDTSPTYEDSFAPYAQMDFIYRTTFTGGAAAGREHVLLCAEGLDTVCEIWLNGKRLAGTENAYTGYEFDVSGLLSAGDNTLCLIFRSPLLEAAARGKKLGVDFPTHLNLPFPYLRKPAYSFFWDWGPQIAVSGVFRPIYLKSFDVAQIVDYYVRYDIARRNVEGTIEVNVRGAEGARATVIIAGQEFSATVSTYRAVVPFQIQDAQLWWPNGVGDPYLYDMQIVVAQGEQVLDTRRQRIGFRTIEVVRDDRKDGLGKRFLFRVNGQDVFMHGYNWIPVDNSIPRGYWDLYRGNLDLAKAGNCNMLRVWGGGYYEDDEFYRLCDERGILVWQDGMFACTLYPDFDPGFLALVKQEITYNIRRLRNFTSLALWCAENECHWGYEDTWAKAARICPPYGYDIYDRLFPELVQQHDPDRFFWNGSPYSEEKGVRANDAFQGDTHYWDLHSNCQDWTEYRNSAPSFVSETGIQSMPDLRTALTVGGPADHDVQSFVFDTRNHYENPAKNERLLKFTGALFRVSTDFAQAVHRSNLAHAEYLKYAVEHWRSQAYDCAGVLIWQINDCWPAISWATVDYNLVPKAAFHYLQRAFAPDIAGFVQEASWDYDPDLNGRGRLFVASERPGLHEGTVELRIRRVTGETLEEHTYPVRLEGPGAVTIGDITLPDYKARRTDCVAEITLRWQDGSSTRNLYTFARPKHMALPAPHVTLTQTGPAAVGVTTDVFAKGVYLFHPDVKVVFDDNYFDLLPGEGRLVSANRPFDVGDVKVITYHH